MYWNNLRWNINKLHIYFKPINNSQLEMNNKQQQKEIIWKSSTLFQANQIYLKYFA